MKRKLLSLILVLTMLVSCIPVFQLGAAAAEIVITSTSDGYKEEGTNFAPSGLKDAKGENSRYAHGQNDKMIYTPDLPAAGNYEVFYYSIKHAESDPAQKIIITYEGGTAEVTVDCVNEEGWVSLGTYKFAKGTAGNVTAVKTGKTGEKPYLRAGGVKFTDSAVGTATPVPTKTPAPSSAPQPNDGKEIVVLSQTDNGMYKEEGTSFAESSLAGADGGKTRYSFGQNDKMIHTPNLAKTGMYQVSVFAVNHGESMPEQKITVNYKGGSKTVALDFTTESGWVLLGTFPMEAGMDGNVTYTRDLPPANKVYMRSGGVKFEWTSDALTDAQCDLPDAELNGAGTTGPTPSPGVMPTPNPSVGPKQDPKPIQEAKVRVSFADLTPDLDWAKNAVELLAGQGIVKGTGENSYSPEAEITRAEFITLAVRLLNSPSAQYGGSLADVHEGDWFASSIQAALDAGIVDSALVQDQQLSPEMPITREEMTSVIVKTYEALSGKGCPTGDSSAFADQNEIADWAKEYVAGAVALGIIKGVGDNRFAPGDKATRGQAAVMIDRLLRTAQAEDGVYLSTTGNDTNDGSLLSPVATLGKAVELAKQTGKTVYVFAGTYQVTQPVVIDADNVSIVAFESQPPVFSGGVQVTGWTKKEGNIYQAKVEGAEDFRQVYVDDLRGIRARYPNEGDPYLTTLGSDDTSMQIKGETGSGVDLLLQDFASHQDEVELSILITWMNKRLRVSDLQRDGENYKATINPVEMTALNTGAQGNKDYKNRRCWLENAYAFIDQPYEWYFDKEEKMLYLYAPDGVDLNAVNVTVPVADSILSLEGKAEQPIQNITLDGITFQYTGWTRPNDYGFVDVQANSLLPIPENDKKDEQFRHDQRKDKIPGAVYANFANDVTIQNCVFTKLGGNGVTFDLGGQNVAFDGNVLYDISGNGFEIGNDAYKPKNDNMTARNVAVRNNYVYDVAKEYVGGIGVLVYYCDSLVVSHNYFKQLPYSAMSLNWGWAIGEAVPLSHDFTVTNNKVERFSQVVNDSGGFYSPNPVYGTNLLKGNYIKGDFISMTDRMLVGLYHDGCSGNWTDTENVVENVPNWIGQVSFPGQAKHDITVYGNYTNQSLSSASLAGDRIEIRDNVQVAGYEYDEKARAIIENAGLEPAYSHLLQVPQGDIELEIAPTFVTLQNGGREKVEVNVTNRTKQQMQVELGLSKDSRFTALGETSLNLAPGESKTVLAEVADVPGAEDALYCETIIATYRGRQKTVTIGVNKTDVTSETVLLSYEDPCYSEPTGSWAGSSLAGFNASKSRYGYENGASAQWNLSQSGQYQVRFYNINQETSARDVTITVKDADGEKTMKINQRELPTGWADLGTYNFSGSEEEFVKAVLATQTSGDDSADFLRMNFLRLDPVK